MKLFYFFVSLNGKQVCWTILTFHEEVDETTLCCIEYFFLPSVVEDGWVSSWCPDFLFIFILASSAVAQGQNDKEKYSKPKYFAGISGNEIRPFFKSSVQGRFNPLLARQFLLFFIVNTFLFLKFNSDLILVLFIIFFHIENLFIFILFQITHFE